MGFPLSVASLAAQKRVAMCTTTQLSAGIILHTTEIETFYETLCYTNLELYSITCSMQ